MSMEELRMILEALGRVGDTAGAGVQWWIVMHYGEKMLSTMAWATVCGIAVWTFKAMVEDSIK